jgi:hypothetical protein
VARGVFFAPAVGTSRHSEAEMTTNKLTTLLVSVFLPEVVIGTNPPDVSDRKRLKQSNMIVACAK